MKNYIIIANGVVSEFETLHEMNKGLELLAGSMVPVYQFINITPCCDACKAGEKCQSETLQRGDEESASDYMDRLKAAGLTEKEIL